MLELKGKVVVDGAFDVGEPVEHLDAAIEDALRALGYTSRTNPATHCATRSSPPMSRPPCARRCNC